MRIIHSGKTLSEETKQKIGKANTGRVQTEDEKRRRAESIRRFYQNNPDKAKLRGLKRKGFKHSEETKKNMSELRKSYYEQIKNPIY